MPASYPQVTLLPKSAKLNLERYLTLSPSAAAASERGRQWLARRGGNTTCLVLQRDRRGWIIPHGNVTCLVIHTAYYLPDHCKRGNHSVELSRATRSRNHTVNAHPAAPAASHLDDITGVTPQVERYAAQLKQRSGLAGAGGRGTFAAVQCALADSNSSRIGTRLLGGLTTVCVL